MRPRRYLQKDNSLLIIYIIFKILICLTLQPDNFVTVLEEEMNLYASQMDIPSSIARNQALVENIFAIVVCFENKIPLIIIGPPGNVYLPFVWRVNIGAKPTSFQEARKLFLLILWPITCAVRIL